MRDVYVCTMYVWEQQQKKNHNVLYHEPKVLSTYYIYYISMYCKLLKSVARAIHTKNAVFLTSFDTTFCTVVIEYFNSTGFLFSTTISKVSHFFAHLLSLDWNSPIQLMFVFWLNSIVLIHGTTISYWFQQKQM